MRIKEALRAYLLSQSALTAIVGQRVYAFDKAPQSDSLPRVTFFLVSTQRNPHFRGISTLTTKRIQVDSWASKADAVEELAEVVYSCLAGFRGDWSGVFVQGCFPADEGDQFRPPNDGSDVGVRRVSQDFMVSLNENVTTQAP